MVRFSAVVYFYSLMLNKTNGFSEHVLGLLTYVTFYNGLRVDKKKLTSFYNKQIHFGCVFGCFWNIAEIYYSLI